MRLIAEEDDVRGRIHAAFEVDEALINRSDTGHIGVPTIGGDVLAVPTALLKAWKKQPNDKLPNQWVVVIDTRSFESAFTLIPLRGNEKSKLYKRCFSKDDKPTISSLIGMNVQVVTSMFYKEPKRSEFKGKPFHWPQRKMNWYVSSF